jgi:hypothetical protein
MGGTGGRRNNSSLRDLSQHQLMEQLDRKSCFVNAETCYSQGVAGRKIRISSLIKNDEIKI